MTTPREEQPRQAEVPVPTVATAPPRSRWRAGWLPVHLGRARTSTVVLALLWLAVFTLYVFVRPPSATPQTSSGTTQQQVDPGRAPTRTSRPAPTSAAPATTPPATTTPEDTATASRTTAPSAPSSTSGGGTTAPTTAGATTAAPTSAAPPGSATEQVPVPTPGPTTAPGPAAPTS